jgi:hypothetical protein
MRWHSPHASDAATVYHVYELRAGFGGRSGRKCDTSKALDFPTHWFGTRRSGFKSTRPDHFAAEARGWSELDWSALGRLTAFEAGIPEG